VAHLPAAVSHLLLQALLIADLRNELNTHLVPQACLLRVLLGATTTVTSFPLSKHPGEGSTTHAFSGRHVYLQFMWEVTLPSLQWSFPHTATFTSFPIPGCWACAATPAFSSWLVYFQFHEGFPLPTSSVLRVPRPLCYMSLLLLLFIQFGFFVSFFPGWGSVFLGGYADLAQGCLWEYRMPLSSPGGLLLPKQSGSWHLVAQEPSGFLCLT
jgi:hypothetical protein